MRRLIMLAGLAVLSVPQGVKAQVVYGGSSTLADTVLQGGAIQGFQSRAGVTLQVADTSGTGKGLKALAEGKVNVVGAGRTLTPDERKAGLLGTIVAYDGLALYVNKANPIKDLSKDQLKDIFTGKVKNWKEVGGKDGPVVPIVEPIASKRATVQLVQELVMDGAPFVSGIREMEQLKDQMVEVSRNEGALCIASVGFMSSVAPNVRAAVHPVAIDATDASDGNIRSGAYLLSRPMLFVTKGLPSGDVKRFVDFMLSKDGQGIVEKFFVAVKK